MPGHLRTLARFRQQSRDKTIRPPPSLRMNFKLDIRKRCRIRRQPFQPIPLAPTQIFRPRPRRLLGRSRFLARRTPPLFLPLPRSHFARRLHANFHIRLLPRHAPSWNRRRLPRLHGLVTAFLESARWGPYAIEQTEKGGVQLYNLFAYGLRAGNLFEMKTPAMAGLCSHPPAACRLATYRAANRLEDKPACAGDPPDFGAKPQMPEKFPAKKEPVPPTETACCGAIPQPMLAKKQ